MANHDHSSTSSSRRTTPPRHTPTRTSGSGTPSGTGTPRHAANRKPLPVFNSYMSLFQVQEKLKKGEVIEGVLRINPKNYEDAYISAPEGAMDIYIGGVRDRNAALHGDVVMVEIKPHDQWKVLYEQLDDYLEKNPSELSIVYNPLESVISASVSSIASSPYNHKSNKTNFVPAIQVKENKLECTNIENVENLGHLEAADSDVVVEDEDVSLEHKEKSAASTDNVKRKRRGRGKKYTNHKSDDEEDKDSTKNEVGQNASSLDSVAGNQCIQSVPKILNQSTGKVVLCESEDEIKGFAVPPDQLSECDFTDDESGCSEILDYDQAREDQEFLKAQWDAYHEQQRQNQSGGASGGNGSSVKPELLAISENAENIDVKVESENKEQNKLTEDIANLSLQSNTKSVSKMGKEDLSAKCVNSVTKDDQEIGVGGVVKTESTQHNAKSSQGAKKKRKPRGKHNFQKSGHNAHTDNNLGVCKEPPMESINKEPDNKKTSVAECLKKSFATTPERDASTNSSQLKGCDTTPNAVQSSPVSISNQATRYNANVNRTPQRDRRSIGENVEATGTPPSKGATPTQHGTRGGRAKENERTTPSVNQVLRLSIGEKFVQRTAFVVYIVERKHPRTAAGTLKLFGDKNPNFALFSPSDYRIPRMKIPMKQCPSDFMARNQDYLGRIFLGKIIQWKDPKFAFGELVRDIGAVGDIEAETEALLAENDIDSSEFPEEVTKDLPRVPWFIPPQEIKSRMDFRNDCIFSIDPATARDLDDAMSCVPLPSGNFRVGVHIADVSYFIPEETPLDKMAADRCTSVYLTQKVIPMLPRVLCEHLCSLNPGEDRLAFSVIWELNPKGKVIGERFGRSVIRSCVKLSYDHAQSMIDDPEREWTAGELPEISGGYTARDISKVVNNLHSIAKHLRTRRFEEGALRLDQVKIAFNLDHETGMPNGFFEYINKDSNRLIEEFMLLANMAVAHKIYNGFPEFAILRRHPPPLEKPMENLGTLLERMDIQLNMSSAGALHNSLKHYFGDDKYSKCRLQVIINLCSRPMQNAKYFCAGTMKNESFCHYALNVPLYTHFTSPIRRYADVMVHRILAAIVDPSRYQPTVRSAYALHRITDRCNDRKQTSKIVQEISTELYLSLFIKQVKQMTEEAMVTMVLDHAFDVLILRLGVIKRVYLDKLPLRFSLTKNEMGKSLHLTWNADDKLPVIEQRINLFTLVSVNLKPFEGNALKFNAILIRPSYDSE